VILEHLREAGMEDVQADMSGTEEILRTRDETNC
jgi:hypothetical protein